jgi:peptide/nickel transport system permease protein
MSGYLLRRFVQMIIVIFLSAVVSYGILYLAPGGPTQGLRQTVQGGGKQISKEDIARIRAYYELDLYLPVRFLRWFMGFPNGPIVIAGQELFANTPVGCRTPVEAVYKDGKTGRYVTEVIGCTDDGWVYLRNLEGRRTSKGIIRGDFGLSWRINRDRPVWDTIIGRLPKTLQLSVTALVLALVFGIPLGIYSAIKQYSRFDYIFTTFAFLGSSMPTFFFGILMILLFSIIFHKIGWPYLPPGSYESVRNYTMPILGTVQAASNLDRFLHMLMPTAVLTMVSISGWSRYIRSSMLEVLRQDYVRTARSKGLLERVVIFKHALRNALIPFVTLIVFALPGVVGGAIITETIFSWPGMGRLYFLALGDADYPVAMAILFISSVLTVIATLLRDIFYTLLDPRIRYS